MTGATRGDRAAWLSDQHRRELEVESAIDPAVVAERGYQTLTRPTAGRSDSRQRLERLGIPRWATKEDRFFPGLLVPMYRATGERISWQWKPNTAVPDGNGKHRKYASVKGQASRLDVHPRNRDRVADPTVPLWITEGVKKADALTSRGLCVVALAGVFNWRSTLGSLGDWEDVPLRGRQVGIAFDADARRNPNVLRAMTRLGKWLESKGAASVAYLIVPDTTPGGVEVKGADDFLAAGGTLDQLMAASSFDPPRPPSTGDAFTDARMAETVAEDVLAGRYLWSAGIGWAAWDGQRWRSCTDKPVTNAVRDYMLGRHADAADQLRAGKVDAAVVDGWRTMLSASKIGAVFRLASGVPGVMVEPSDLDAHPDLLNAANGVVDLRTGQLRPHDPDLLLTKVTPVAYDPDARHDDWDAALTALPDDVRSWFQVRVGQAATGHMTPDDVLVVQVGGGENGKTTVATGIRAALGEYHVNVSHRALIGDASQHPTELMAFRGARFAMLEETPEARRLSTVRLKQTVGTPQMRARYIKQDEVEWDATHSLFLSSNYRPEVEETDHGTWRRLALLTYPYTYKRPGLQVEASAGERPGDPMLRDRLAAGGSGQHEAVLAWIVAGSAAWYAAERAMPVLPPTVETETREWRAESDLVLAYLDDRLVFDTSGHVAKSDLLADFNGWLVERGHRGWSDKTLAARFGAHSETTRHHVAAERRRATDRGLSRPVNGHGWVAQTPVPGRFHAWLGVRFRTVVDDHTDPVRDGWDGSSGNPSRGTYFLPTRSAVPPVPTSAPTGVANTVRSGLAAPHEWRDGCCSLPDYHSIHDVVAGVAL